MTDIYEANGVKFHAADDMIVRWCRKEHKPFEPRTTEWMIDVMERRGGVFVDVGASTGWFSCLFAARGYVVHAFEPNPNVLPRLRQNMALNGASATIHAAAASSASGHAAFHYNKHLKLTSGGTLNRAECLAPTGREVVRTARLDDLWQDGAIANPSLLKIDVEGHEIDVLKGAKTLIETAKPHLVLEANTESHRDRLLDWLGDAYSVEDADERNLLCKPVS